MAQLWDADALGKNSLGLLILPVGVLTSLAQSRLFREQLSLVYPAEIEHYGLSLVLQSSGIAAAWEHTARLATPQLTGDPFQLSLDLQLAAYRSLCEAVTLLLECESGSILIRARCGHHGAHRGILGCRSCCFDRDG
ncbi:MAG: hypothetical protein ACREO8_13415 [Luteimonas sp.]